MPSFLFQALNLDLLTVGVSVAGMTVLGCVIFLSNPKGLTNLIFLGLALTASVWGVVNYLSYQVPSFVLSFVLLRLVLFFGVWSAFFTYYLAVVFISTNFKFFNLKNTLVLLVNISVSLLTVTDYVFRDIGQLGVDDRAISSVINGPGILIFGAWVMFLNLGAVINLVFKYFRANVSQRKSLSLILLGMGIMLGLISIFNFVLPAFFGVVSFIPLGALFLLPFVFFTGYAISRHGLFNVKVVGTSLLVFALSITTFVEIVFSESAAVVFHRSIVLLLVLVFGVLLIRGVIREIEQREKIEKQEKELEISNQKQVALLHFITHQIKGFFTKSKFIFAAMTEGDYGALPTPVLEAAREGLSSDNKGITMVGDILNAANLQKGTVKYQMKPIELSSLVLRVIEDQKKNAEAKGLQFNVDIDAHQIFKIVGDEEHIRQAIKNVIDNAVHYTLEGGIKISLQKTVVDGIRKILFSSKDSGVGIAEEDRGRLFTEGGMGKDSIKVNTESTGYGLYIVKQIVEAHGGRVWAESKGRGKGSEFYIELPEDR